ncbi:NAD(P)-dependent alcohol dehydrogenase [Nocardia sp. NPDC004340]
MTAVLAYSAMTSDSPLVLTEISRRALGERDVLIDIHYSGVCHTDIHIARNDWRTSIYPVVPGHEIAGIVRQAGAAVTGFAPGDRVGVGCFVDSCRTCPACRGGAEQHCTRGVTLTYNSETGDGPTEGGYATSIVVDERFVLGIPDALPLPFAAPLMCAGTTTYAPLRRFGVRSGTRVGVIGLGGLGHLGVLLAKAMGADVTVFSRSAAKLDDAFRFGADRYVITEDPGAFEKYSCSQDLILNTVSSKIDLNAYFGTLDRNGVLVELGIPDVPLELEGFSLILMDRQLAGSFVGSPGDTREMLEFCAAHNIRPEIELIAADRVNEAFERVLSGAVRYRFVLDIEGMRTAP